MTGLDGIIRWFLNLNLVYLLVFITPTSLIAKIASSEALRSARETLKKIELEFAERHGGKIGPELWYRIPHSFFAKTNVPIKRILKNQGSKDGPMGYAKLLHPNSKFLPWKFCKIPNGTWDSLKNRREYFDWIALELEVNEESDWYSKLDSGVIKRKYGASLLKRYSHFTEILIEVMPDIDWKPWLFKKLPKGYWEKKENRRKYFLWLFDIYGNGNFNDFIANFNLNLAEKNKGNGFRKYYNKHSDTNPVLDLFGDMASKVNRVITSTSSIEEVREAITWFIREVKKEKINHDSLYSFTLSELNSCCRQALVSKNFGNTFYEVMGNIFIDFDLKPWKFRRKLVGFFGKKENRTKFMKWLQQQLNWNIEDFYRLSYLILKNYNGSRAPFYTGGISLLVGETFSDRKWDYSKFDSRKSGQTRLYELTEKITGLDFLYDHRHPKIRFKKTNYPVEYDVYFENGQKKIALEFHGKQHYIPIDFFGGKKAFDEIKERDREKKELSIINGVCLFIVSYKWDLSLANLKEILSKQLTVYKNRGDSCGEIIQFKI